MTGSGSTSARELGALHFRQWQSVGGSPQISAQRWLLLAIPAIEPAMLVQVPSVLTGAGGTFLLGAALPYLQDGGSMVDSPSAAR